MSRPKLRRQLGLSRALTIGASSSILLAVVLSSASFYISAKALLAQQLLQHAWNTSIESGVGTKPWSWADVNTTARLNLPSINASVVVLSDASGEAMAFGPGLVAGNPLNAQAESLAIGGHRDTHLAFLEHMAIDSPIELQALDGTTHRYKLLDKQIVDSSKTSLAIATTTPGLILITCYPFNATQTGGPLRMVARAVYQPWKPPNIRL